MSFVGAFLTPSGIGSPIVFFATSSARYHASVVARDFFTFESTVTTCAKISPDSGIPTLSTA